MTLTRIPQALKDKRDEVVAFHERKPNWLIVKALALYASQTAKRKKHPNVIACILVGSIVAMGLIIGACNSNIVMRKNFRYSVEPPRRTRLRSSTTHLAPKTFWYDYKNELSMGKIEMNKECLLKDVDEDIWIDLIDENLRKTSPKQWNQQENVFASVMFFHAYMSAGLLEYYTFHDDLNSMQTIEESLAEIEADQYLEVVAQANVIYRKIHQIVMETDDEERMEELVVPYEDEMRKLDNKLYALQENKPLKAILLDYVKQHDCQIWTIKAITP